MAFERRKSGRSYMYVGVRDRATGRVRKVYLGNGHHAEAAAAAIAGRQSAAIADRKAVADAEAATRAADALTAALTDAVSILVEAAMLADGWHRPNYGPWRRKRHGHGRHGIGPAADLAGGGPG